MERQLIITEDGSHTLFVPELKETYHSTRGARQESVHVFLQAGMHYMLQYLSINKLNILEVGFGTGLNALLTWQEAEALECKVYYETLEKYPLDLKKIEALNYEPADCLLQLHVAEWNKPEELSPYFELCKRQMDLLDYSSSLKFDVIYFDAFAPTVQPELWSGAVFRCLNDVLNPGGVLVTYSSKGIVKELLRESGFDVYRLAGAGGKRHMLRAVKK
jgi:tRNA U34 5-methylaminomethyl-2-thiouridine-forming methyltransferase MnmC